MSKHRNSLRCVAAVYAMLVCLAGVAGAQVLSSTSLAYGNWVINTTASKLVTLTNNQTIPLTISSISVSGEFTESTKCPLAPNVLAPGASCNILVVFAPTTLGTLSGTLFITDDASSSPQTVALSGAGVLAVAFLPGSLAFGEQLISTVSPPLVLTLQNYQTVPLQISGITTTGNFNQTTSNCPVAPSTLAARSNCTISVSFAPASAGALAGQVTVTDNATDSPQAALSGTGVQSSLGTISGVLENQCPPGAEPGVCYGMTVSCPSVADLHANLKVTTVSNPIGTMVLDSGGNGTSLWEAAVYGPLSINNLLAAGYNIAQMVWVAPDGWQIGPGGVLAVACRPATVINWIYNNIHQNGASAPICAAGTSAGAEQIGLGLAHYNLGSILSMAELISGPPFSHEDTACECNQPYRPDPCGNTALSQCVGTYDAIRFVDPAYSSPICSQATKTHSTVNEATFLADSVLSPDANLNYPNTYVHFVFGGLDTSLSPVMGQDYQLAITTSTGLACVADAPHEVLSVKDGAEQVSNDLISGCHLYGSRKIADH